MARTRLCLITPAPLPEEFDSRLSAALAGGDVASLLIAPGRAGDELVGRIVRTANDLGVASVAIGQPVPDKADGIQIETGPRDVATARRSLGDGRIVGAGGIGSRHDAMTLGEQLPDYLFFGRIDGDDEPGIHPKALELAAWWAALFQIPAMVMGGKEVISVEEAAAAGIEFVALREAVWNHPGGPEQAVAEANAILDRIARE